MADDARKLNKELYDALMKGDTDKAIRLCEGIPKGPLHALTIHHDTVLHMATYSKQSYLVMELLNMVREVYYHKLTCQNDVGNTVLHEAATSDRIVPAAMEMLRRAPTLLSMPNRRGETPIFRAARYGKNRMYDFLDAEMHKTIQSDADLRSFHFRDDKTSILHISILTEHYDLALKIAAKYRYLIDERDGDGMTALQLLACNPSAFHGGEEVGGSLIKKFIYARIKTGGTVTEKGWTVPLWEQLRDQKHRYDSVIELARFLIERDTTWEATESALDKSKPKTHRYGRTTSMGPQDQGQISTTGQETTTVDIAETPLFLATKSGCTEIVRGILEMYPQAVEHVDDEGRNILHVAIKYRQIQIFDIVEKMETPMTRLIRKIDNNGNSILHMVGIKATEAGHEDMRSPALILQEDLLLFERVKKISATHFTKHYNAQGVTAEKLFAINNAQHRMDAKEWMKGTAENCSIVAVLIATVAFAAAYTVPGGPNQETGYPILENQPFFFLFTMTDVLSLAFALTSVILFLNILTSSFRLKDFRQSLPQKLMMGVTLLILSVSMMMVAFAATVILLIRNKEKWTRVALYSVAFFPVLIFAFSYLPLYVSLVKTFSYTLKKIRHVVPRCDSSDPSKTDGAVIPNSVSNSTYPIQSITPDTNRFVV
ncbi:protein ACCELERATED CELL DEATH 6 isoform X2 [Lactuca sativa]|uniref:protein ACCELERATED CELL DEATH 6 isoform X2 n=1 Tax=Lactuca sativa TaxID=4236 RepID=UPI001C689ECE|nr:protein ACCELERATED CELL DEATH 6 isoform X2 [Lactuca sativa]